MVVTQICRSLLYCCFNSLLFVCISFDFVDNIQTPFHFISFLPFIFNATKNCNIDYIVLKFMNPYFQGYKLNIYRIAQCLTLTINTESDSQQIQIFKILPYGLSVVVKKDLIKKDNIKLTSNYAIMLPSVMCLQKVELLCDFGLSIKIPQI